MKYKIILLLILLLAFLVRIHPILVGSLLGPDPNFHLRMTVLWVENQGKPFYDLLSMQGRYYSYPPLYHLSYALLNIVSSINISFLIQLFPAVYGILGILVVFIFARRLFDERTALFASFVLAIMPMHIVRTYSYARPDGLALLFVPAIIYLLYINREKIAALLSIALVLLHPLSTLYLLTFLIFWVIVFKVKGKQIHAKKFFSIILLVFVVFLLWLFSQNYPFTEYVSFTSFESSELTNLTLNSIFSFFTFSWLFVLIGLFKLKNNLFLKSWFGFSLLYAVIGLRLAFFLTFPAAIIAGFALNFILQQVKKYQKPFFFLILILALITVIPRIDGIGKYIPDSEKSAMFWLKENSDENSSIASQWDRGHPLTRFASRKVVIDGYFEFAPGLEQRNASIHNIITTSNCNKIMAGVNRWQIDYFFVPASGLYNMSYKNGILEAYDCNSMYAVFESDGSKIFYYKR